MVKIRKILNEIGVPTHIKGYEYLIRGIDYCKQRENVSITKELYPHIAQLCNDTPNKVSKAMCHAIECAFKQGHNTEIIKSIFGNSINSKKSKPTNGQFCKSVAIYLKYEMEE